MTNQGKQLVDTIFDDWNRGETTDDFTIRQLNRVIEVTSDDEVKILAVASLETVKANNV